MKAICEKILDFSNALPYILPRNFVRLPFKFGSTIIRHLSRITQFRRVSEALFLKLLISESAF